jgi:hypothetical protein
MGSSPKKNSAKSKAAAAGTELNVVDVAAETAALDAAIAAASNNNGAATSTSTKKSSSTAAASSSKPKTAAAAAAAHTTTTTSASSVWWYEAGWGAVMLYGLYVAATTAYNIRLGAINEYGPVIHEFDPYFNYRATEVKRECVWQNERFQCHSISEESTLCPLNCSLLLTLALECNIP